MGFFLTRINYIRVRINSDYKTWFNGGLKVELSKGEKVEISRRQAIRFKEVFSI